MATEKLKAFDFSGTNKLLVTLVGGVKIYIVDKHPTKENVFLGKYIPCAKNSRTYEIPFNEIVSCD